jgi:hypothetical protein
MGHCCVKSEAARLPDQHIRAAGGFAIRPTPATLTIHAI